MVEALHEGGLLLVGQQDVHPINRGKYWLTLYLIGILKFCGSYEKEGRQFKFNLLFESDGEFLE